MQIYIRELTCRYRRVRVESSGAISKRIANSADVARTFAFLSEVDREQFVAVYLNARNKILSFQIVSVGTLTGSLVHPREVFKGAILANAAAVVLIHNHPSGDANPSGEDLTVTKRLVDAGELLGIRVLDHLILGDPGYVSMADRGLMTMEGKDLV